MAPSESSPAGTELAFRPAPAFIGTTLSAVDQSHTPADGCTSFHNAPEFPSIRTQLGPIALRMFVSSPMSTASIPNKLPVP